MNEQDNFKDIVFNTIEESNKSKIINCLKKDLNNVDDKIKISISNSLLSFIFLDIDSEDELIFEDGIMFWDRLPHKDITFKKRNFN